MRAADADGADLHLVEHGDGQKVEDGEVYVDENREDQHGPDTGFGGAVENAEDAHGTGDFGKPDVRMRVDQAPQGAERHGRLLPELGERRGVRQIKAGGQG
jgi:hypothetical protein